MVVQIVEKKGRKGNLYPAIKNERTGGYSYQPTGRNTPISFDPSRHRLEFKTPAFAKSVSEVLIAAEDDSQCDNEENFPKRTKTTKSVQTKAANKRMRLESDEDDHVRDSPSDDEPETTKRAKASKPIKAVAKPSKKAAKAVTDDSVTEKEDKRMQRSKRTKTTKNSYKEDDESNADHDESDFEQEQRPRKKKVKTGPATKNTTKHTQAKKKRKKSTNDDDTVNTADESDIESPVARSSAKKAVYDPFVTASWEEGGDWRSEGAIDY